MASLSATPGGIKRLQRGPSTEILSALESQVPPKRQEREQSRGMEHVQALAPLLQPAAGESQAAYFSRLASRLRPGIFSVAHAFSHDGLYIYKRPVRSEHGDKASLLASGGSVFYHVVVYVKQGEQLAALEFGPGNQMDITDNMLAEAAPGPVYLHPAPEPEAQHLPMLHIAAPHHQLDAPHVQQALRFAEGTMYHALRNNCICFADFAVRVLTGGAVRGAPLVFDCLAGQVPATESPLLPMLSLMMQMSWHDVTDGSRLLSAYLAAHPAGLLPPPAGTEALSLLTDDPEEPAVVSSAGTAQQLNGATLSALLGLLPPGMAASALPALAGMANPGMPALSVPSMPSMPAYAAPPPSAQEPSEDSDGSDDTVEAAQLDSRPASVATAAATSNSTGCASRPPVGGRGLALPPRKARK